MKRLAILMISMAAIGGNTALAKDGAAWPDYQIIMWQDHDAGQDAALRQLGITAGKVMANRTERGPFVDEQIAPLQKAGLPWYVENIATDFYAAYHRFTPDHPPNRQFLEAQRLYWENPSDTRALVRQPSLSDAAWQAKIHDRLIATVRAQSRYAPLYYSLGDETGVGDLAAFWDFDIGRQSVEAMRLWLKDQYGTLLALNRQWGTAYTGWDQVQPETTAKAMARTDENFSAWADFKAWMDIAYARALKAGTDAVHEGDPKALAGIEGGQIPGWGGYDYTRLVDVVDVMELYDFGRNVDIVRSLNPAMVMLTTSSESGPAEIHRIWQELLKGSRGLILWDENNEFLGARGQEAAPLFHELRSGLAKALISGHPIYDPVAILYSPASMRTAWMLDWKPKGDAWSRRKAEDEYTDNPPVRTAMENFASGIEHAGLRPRFVSPALLEHGELEKTGVKVLILPHTVSLSATEAQAVGRFVDAGGTVIADSEPGLFDEHSKRLAEPSLTDLFPHKPTGTVERFPFGPGRAVYLPSDSAEIGKILAEAKVTSIFAVSDSNGSQAQGLSIYRYASGNGTILALQRDPADGVSAPHAVSIHLPQAAMVTDLRTQRALGRTDRLDVTVGPIEPTILSIVPVN